MIIFIILSLNYFLFISIKPFMFINSIFFFRRNIIFLIPLINFTLIILYNLKFFYNLKFDKLKYFNITWLIIVSILICYISENLFLFILLFELSLIPISFIIINFRKDRDKINSTIFIIIINTIGSIFFILFILFTELTNLRLSIIFNFNLNINIVRRILIWLISSILLIFKLPLITIHIWLTKAHVRASGPISIILAGILLKVSTLGFFKLSIFFLPLKLLIITIYTFFLYPTIIIFTFLIIRCFDIKYIVALSSIMHISIIPIIRSIFNSQGLIRSIIIIISHGIISSILFYLIIIIYEKSQNRNLEFNKSLRRSRKILSFIFILFILLNFGIPPLVRFISEYYFILNLIKNSIILSFTFLFSILIVNSIIILIWTKIELGKKINLNFNNSNCEFLSKAFSSIYFIITIPFYL